MTKARWTILLGVLGIVVILTYIGAALGIIRNVNALILALVFAIGPVAIVGVLEIHNCLAAAGSRVKPNELHDLRRSDGQLQIIQTRSSDLAYLGVGLSTWSTAPVTGGRISVTKVTRVP